MVKTDHNLIRNITLYGRDRTAMSVQHNSMQGYRYCQSGKIDSNKYHCGVTAASTCFLSANAGSAVIADNLCPDRCRVAARLPRAAGRRFPAIVELQLKLHTLQAPAWLCLGMPGAAGRRQRTQAGGRCRDGSAQAAAVAGCGWPYGWPWEPEFITAAMAADGSPLDGSRTSGNQRIIRLKALFMSLR